MDHNCNCEKNSLCFARYHLETTITVISFSVLQIALLHLLNSSVTLMQLSDTLHAYKNPFFLRAHCGEVASSLVRLSWPHQGTVPRVVTQLWRPPAAWVLPPSRSLPVTRVEGQNSTEWTHRINSSKPGQGQCQKEKAFVYKRSSPYWQGMKQRTAFFTAWGPGHMNLNAVT